MAKLTTEEWQKLTPQEQETRKEEIPDNYTPPSGVKEDVVVINGQERSLKNYEGEARRRIEAEVRAEYDEKLRSSLTTPPAQPPAGQQNWLDQLYTMGENEIATTGKAVPMQTILQAADIIARNNVASVFQSQKKANTVINSFKREFRSEPDWKETEDKFDEYVDQLTPDRINKATLEVIFNAVRGQRMKEIVAKATEKAKVGDNPDTGNPTFSNSARKPSGEGLTSEQKKEWESYNADNNMEWTEKEYLSALKKKQEQFKIRGARNTPQLLSDAVIK